MEFLIYPAKNDTHVVEIPNCHTYVHQESVQDLVNLINEMVDTDKKKLIIDFQKVGRVSSLGIGAVVACLNKVNDAGGRLVLARLPKNGSKTFDMTKVSNEIDMHDDLITAINSFK